jgi:hypothetical protein
MTRRICATYKFRLGTDWKLYAAIALANTASGSMSNIEFAFAGSKATPTMLKSLTITNAAAQ